MPNHNLQLGDKVYIGYTNRSRREAEARNLRAIVFKFHHSQFYGAKAVVKIISGQNDYDRVAFVGRREIIDFTSLFKIEED